MLRFQFLSLFVLTCTATSHHAFAQAARTTLAGDPPSGVVTTPAPGLPVTPGFLECNDVLHTLTGERAGDQFGWVSFAVPDVDGDGAQEFVTSSPFYDTSFNNAGRIYLYSGATGAELFRVSGKGTGENLGSSLATAGDVDGDGIGDILAGAPHQSTRKGLVRVLSGADGSELFVLSPGQVGDRLGTTVAGVGDVDGDGWVDFALGAPLGSATLSAGLVYIVSGQDGSTVLFTLEGIKNGDQFGSGMGVLGDVNGDGKPELAIGSMNGGRFNRGHVRVYDLQTQAVLYTKSPDATGVNFGQFFVYSMGDVNADGWPDLYVSDFADGGGRGKAYIYDGPTGALIWKLFGAPGDGFGIGRDAGDVNGDGFADMLLASWVNSTGANRAGKAEVFSGRTGGILRTVVSTTQNETLGFDAHGVGDVNGDGNPDFVLTAAGNAANRGRVYVVAGGTPVRSFGAGTPGTSGIVPSLDFQGCPQSGAAVTLEVQGVLGGALGCLAIGTTRTAISKWGGTLYTTGDVLLLPHVATGPAGAAGGGSFRLDDVVPNDVSLIGVPFFAQAGYLDPGSASGVTLTEGLRLQVY